MEIKMARKTYKTYFVSKENNWGTPRWVVWKENCSPFGRYPTKTAAIKDCRTYGIKLEER
jgi:hypothetical protein